MTSLRALQETFWTLITAPDGVPEHPWTARTIASDQSASAQERLDVYANMYFFRLLENLSLDFPRVAALVGPTGFHNLITDYLAACPSRDPSVRNVGRALPTFLQDHQASPPWLADLAALEWARLDVADRTDIPLLTASELASAAAHGFATLRLELIEAHDTLPLRFAVEPIWREQQPEVQQQPRTLLVWRKPDCSIHHRSLDPDELRLFPKLRAGLSFIDLCAHLGRTQPAHQAARRALALTSSWTASALLQRSDSLRSRDRE
jgi:hypothetical protein